MYGPLFTHPACGLKYNARICFGGDNCLNAMNGDPAVDWKRGEGNLAN